MDANTGFPSEDQPSSSKVGHSDFSPRIGRKDRLVAACDFLAGKAGASAEEPWTVQRWPVIRDQQVAWLKEWALDQECWINAEALGRRERGRMEHDLFPEVEAERRMWKMTKGVGFGRQPFCEEHLVSGMVSDWFTARPGSPLQYLQRLRLVNEELFPGMYQLEGVTEWMGKFAIVVSQPMIVGENASESEIETFFSQAGFVKICHGTWFRETNPLAVFDAGRTNLIASGGLPVPIDVIPIIPTGAFLGRLLEALHGKVWVP
jgi:hypothetical protein